MYYVSCIIYTCRQRDGKQQCFRKEKNRQMAGYPYHWPVFLSKIWYVPTIDSNLWE